MALRKTSFSRAGHALPDSKSHHSSGLRYASHRLECISVSSTVRDHVCVCKNPISSDLTHKGLVFFYNRKPERDYLLC